MTLPAPAASGGTAGTCEQRSIDACRIVLPEALDLKGVRGLKEQLGAALRAGRPVAVDAGGVTRVSTASLQILAAFLAAATKAGMTASLVNASLPLRAAVTDLGLATLIPVPETETSPCAF